MNKDERETCLWVIDLRVKVHNGHAHINPEDFRCTPGGIVFCRPCVTKFQEAGLL